MDGPLSKVCPIGRIMGGEMGGKKGRVIGEEKGVGLEVEKRERVNGWKRENG